MPGGGARVHVYVFQGRWSYITIGGEIVISIRLLSKPLAIIFGLAVLFVTVPVDEVLGGDLQVEITKTKGRGSDCQYRYGSSGPYTRWGNVQNTRTFKTCQWVKIQNSHGGLEVACLCGGPNCGCKKFKLKKGKFHIPSSCASWPGGSITQTGATLYDVYDGKIETRGGAGCGGEMPGCLAPQVGFNSPVAQACGEWSEPPGETSWFTADYDSATQKCRILNHPSSAMPMLSRSVSGPDTITITQIYPGEGLIYDVDGPQPAAVGIFVGDDPEGMPGTWVPVEFEIVNTGITESFFDVYLEEDQGWPMGEQYFNAFLNPGESFLACSQVYIPDETAPHSVCAVMATASALDDVYEQWTQVSVMPDVTIDLMPHQRGLQHGDELIITVSLHNNTALSRTIDGQVGILMPDGQPYPGNPLIGPFTLPLEPDGSIVVNIGHTIPFQAPFGSYVYTAYIGTYDPPSLLDQSGFGFVVME